MQKDRAAILASKRRPRKSKSQGHIQLARKLAHSFNEWIGEKNLKLLHGYMHRMSENPKGLGLGYTRKLAQEGLIEGDAGVEICDRKIFVGRVRATIGRCEAYQNGTTAENGLECFQNRNGAAFTEQGWWAAKDLVQRALGRKAIRTLRIAEEGLATVAALDLQTNSNWALRL